MKLSTNLLEYRNFLTIIAVLLISAIVGYFVGQGQTRILAIPAVFFAGLIFLIKPRWAYYLFIFVIPLEWQLRLMFGASVYRLIGMGVVGIWILHKLIYREKLEPGPLDFPLVVLMCMALLTFFYTPSVSKWQLGISTYIQLIIFVFVTRDQLKGEEHLKIVLTIYVIGALIGCVITIQEYITYDNFSYYRRISGSTGDANTSSLTYIYSFPIIMFWISNHFSLLKKLIGMSLIGLIVFATLVTISRTGMIVLSVAIVLYIITVTYRSVGSSKTLGITMIFVFAFILLSGFIPWENIFYRFSETASAEGGAEFGGRAGAYSVYLESVFSGGLLGHGLNTRLYISAHNQLIEIVFQLGLIGLTAFLGLWWIGWNSVNQAIKISDQYNAIKSKNFYLSFRVSIICLFLFSMTLSNDQDQLVWLTFALAEKCRQVTKDIQPTKEVLNLSKS